MPDLTDTVEVVERPTTAPRRGRKPKYPAQTKALLRTLVNGTAVKIPLNGQTARIVAARIAKQAQAKGYRVTYRTDADAIIAWIRK